MALWRTTKPILINNALYVHIFWGRAWWLVNKPKRVAPSKIQMLSRYYCDWRPLIHLFACYMFCHLGYNLADLFLINWQALNLSKCLSSYGIRRFITALKTASHEHCNERYEATPNPVSLRCILLLSSRLHLGFSKWLLHLKLIRIKFCMHLSLCSFSVTRTVTDVSGVELSTVKWRLPGQIPSLASIRQTIFLRVFCDVIDVALFTDLCVTMNRP